MTNAEGGKVGMSETEQVINDLNTAKLILCNPKILTPEMCVRIGQTVTSAINLLTEQESENGRHEVKWND